MRTTSVGELRKRIDDLIDVLARDVQVRNQPQHGGGRHDDAVFTQLARNVGRVQLRDAHERLAIAADHHIFTRRCLVDQLRKPGDSQTSHQRPKASAASAW